MHTKISPALLKISPALLVWACAGAIANFFTSTTIGDGAPMAQMLLSVIGLAHSIVVFWVDGENRISVPGVFAFGTGLFCYFPGIYLCFSNPIRHGEMSTVLALNIALFAQLLLYYFLWKPRPQQTPSALPLQSRAVSYRWMRIGATLSAVGIASSYAGLSVFGLANGAAYAGVVIFAVASFGRRGRITILTYLVAVGLFALYVEFVFTGFGRLQVGSLGIALAMAVAHRWPNRAVKASILAVSIPAMAYFAESRVQYTATLNPNQSSDTDGLGSVLMPLVRFSEIIHLDSIGQIPYSYGHTYFTALVALVPRSIWPDKPDGFGAVLADFFRPQYRGTGYSEAALFYSEWVFSFGLLTVILIALATGYLVRVLDQKLVQQYSTALEDDRTILTITALILVGSSMLDFIWAGSFTLMSRVGPRLLVVLIVFIVLAALKKKNYSTRPSLKNYLEKPKLVDLPENADAR